MIFNKMLLISSAVALALGTSGAIANSHNDVLKEPTVTLKVSTKNSLLFLQHRMSAI